MCIKTFIRHLMVIVFHFTYTRPCDAHGTFLPPGSVPEPLSEKTPNDWAPFRNCTEFEMTPATQINRLLDLPPFADYRDLYKTIDNIPVGNVKWQDQTFDVWYQDLHQVVQNILRNPDYFSTDGNVCQWKDFMSGDWAWNQAISTTDLIATDPETHRSTFMPVVLGSDKTTVSVATGNNEYYPLYASIGNVHNNVQCAHRKALAIVGFLAIPKTTKEHASDPKFRKFRHQLFQSSLAKILERLWPGMTKPEVMHFGDGHFWCIIYGLGPYIADYEEQVLLACIVQGWCARCLGPHTNLDEPASERCHEHTEALVEEATLGDLWDEYGIVGDLVPFTNDFPRADIHELIAPDLLHQLIKVKKIVATPSFAGLRHFPQGRGFKQWTGHDSKALMKVYLPTIEGHVPIEVVQIFCTFLKFCYLVHRNIITEKMLDEIQDALDHFPQYREIFKTTEVIEMFSLPCQHSLQHYIHLICLFGAPNGLCSSITKSKHIKVVKEPWQCLSWYKSLGQMLVTNEHLNKLIRIANNGPGNPLREDTKPEVNVQEDEDVGDVEIDSGPTVIQAHVELVKTPLSALVLELSIPQLPNMLCCFLFVQLNPNDPRDPLQIPPADGPQYDERISVFNSACSRFFAPSDISGIGGMCCKHICALLTFFSFTYRAETYPCAVVQWFDTLRELPDNDTSMWMVQPTHHANNAPHIAIIHVNLIYRAAHLIPIYSSQFIPPNLQHYQTYDSFHRFYINKYANHHSFKIVS
ncbi:hypothetical protein F4604DRAFT_1883666 [Suillus subluteus]|nr:hypothetical protein F4604DRAFT_1883666 [Suillus subluteus]